MAAFNSVVHFRRQWGILLLVLSALAASAQRPPDEFEIKAVYLIKFVQFVDWPSTDFAAKDSPLVIGVLGSDPFGQVLDEVAKGEAVKNHRVTIRRLPDLKKAGDIQVLFVSSSERSHVHSILSTLKGRSILTASDLDDFSKQGGIVRFVVENKKVHFLINIDAARRANLPISSKLLELAEVVHDSHP